MGALQLSTLLQMVAAGSGISLVPRMSVAQRPEGVVFLPFRGMTPHREINALRNASHYQSKAALAVAEIGRELVRGAIQGGRAD